MTTDKVQKSKEVNKIEFKEFQLRLAKRYLSKNIHKQNRVIMKSDASSEADKQKAMSKASSEAKAMATKVENNKQENNVQQQNNAAQANQANELKEKIKTQKNKKAFDPVNILAKVEKENRNEDKKIKKPTLLQSINSYVGALNMKASKLITKNINKKKDEENKLNKKATA